MAKFFHTRSFRFPAASEKPIRIAYHDDDALAAAAKNIASGKAGLPPHYLPLRLRARLQDNADMLLHVFRATDAAARRQETLSPAAQWLVDNYYTLDKAVKQARLACPQKLLRRLPHYPRQKELPRVFAFAWFYVACKDSCFSLQSLTAAIRSYQTSTPLLISELSVLPAALRFALTENARRIAAIIEYRREMRLFADNAADEIILIYRNGRQDTHHAALRAVLKKYQKYIGNASFSEKLLSRLENAAVDTAAALQYLRSKLENLTPDADNGSGSAGSGKEKRHAAPWNENSLLAAEQNSQTMNGMTMGNIIRSLKAIDDCDWSIWFESVCSVDLILRENSDFSALDAASRSLYRDAVEDIAKSSPLSETQVAEQAIKLSRAAEKTAGGSAKDLRAAAAAKDISRKAGAAEFLLGKKRPLLEKACRSRRTPAAGCAVFIKKLKIGAIALPVFALTLLLLAAVYALCLYGGVPPHSRFFCLLLAALPTADAAFAVFNMLASWAVSPKPLVGYAYRDGIPDHAACLVAVPVLIHSEQNIDEQIRTLEVHYLSNPRGAVYFALISDWRDAKHAQTAADTHLLEYARRQIAALNRRYPTARENIPLFHFLHRRRLFNAGENCFMGWERKRGKLHELNRLLRGAQDTSFFPSETALPKNIRYVLTLDSDTRLLPGSVAKLVGKLSHPLNAARRNPKTGQIEEGYGLLQPRITPSLAEGEQASVLQRIFSSERGLDLYVFAVSDTYQDIVGEGTYTGKGLYEIDVFESAMSGRIAENTVLSHDLLEGGYARTAFVNDVEMVEDYPSSYYVDTMRRHRWTRGDWQLLPYIFGRTGARTAARKKSEGGGISAVTRWKMLDNLRRSLMSAAMLAAFIGGWLLLPARQALIWQCVLLLSLYSAPLLGFLRQTFTVSSENMLRGHIRAAARQAGLLLAHMLLSLSFLAYNTWWTADAIIRALYRLTISRRHLLEWQSSDTVKNLPKTGHIAAYMRAMFPAVIIAGAALWAVIRRGYDSGSLYIALPLILLWLFSPIIAWFCSRPAVKSDALPLKAADKAALRAMARRDWAFYEAFTDKENHFLPPDNFQETPKPALARRTSPTNIGLYLLSVVSARDFGWISLQETAERLRATLQSLEKMEKFRGHIYNWHETDSLKPLEPLYISTVDSGNLAGHLLALSAALKQWAAQSNAALCGDAAGIIDNADILAEALAAMPLPKQNDTADYRQKSIILQNRQLPQLRKQAVLAAKASAAQKENWQERCQVFSALEKDAAAIARQCNDIFCKNTAESDKMLFLRQAAAALLNACRAHKQDCMMAQKLRKNEKEQQAFTALLTETAQQAEAPAFAMQFDFLANKDRRLLSIGYRVREQQIDESCYDLLASEARLAVLFSIAKGDVKYEYWARLGRAGVAVGWKSALLSWSGSMFEYLMPPLVMQEPRGSLLDQTNNLAVRRQREYGHSLKLPWGISEAAFNARDTYMNYQYSAFGVPSLGLQRGLSRNRVIAPYATALAAQYAPNAAMRNLRKLRILGALGRYGYYDSLDFTPSRVPQGQAYSIVRNYYAHHHGMSIIAANNAVHNNIMRRRFHSNACIEAVSLLLQERAPRAIPFMNAKALNPLRSDTDRAEQNSVRVTEDPLRAPRAAQLLSSGAYRLMLTARGSGYSMWGGFAVTRYQTDAVENDQGSFLFLRDCASGQWWSAAAEPTCRAEEETKTIFTAEKAEFYKTAHGIHSAVECLAMAGGEARRIKIFNRSRHERILEIVSYSELALNIPADDAAHPAFSRLFAETETARQDRVIFARRRPRSSKEPPIHAAHCVTAAEGEILSAQAETDRRAFIGRGRSLRNPIIFEKAGGENISDAAKTKTASAAGSSADNAAHYTLDPIFSICCRIKIPPHRKAELVFWTMAAENRPELESMLSECKRGDAFDRAFSAVWTHSQIIRHRIGLTPQNISDYQKYASFLLFPEKQWQAPKMIAQNLGRQADLWPISVSGDRPLCVLRIADEEDLPIAAEWLRAHEYWRCCGLTADLILLNEQPHSYAQNLQRALEWQAESYRRRARDSQGKDHVFILRKDQMSKQSLQTLLSAAQIVLFAGNGSAAEQLAHWQSLNAGNSAIMQDKQQNAAPQKFAAGARPYEERQRQTLQTGRKQEQENIQARGIDVTATSSDAVKSADTGIKRKITAEAAAQNTAKAKTDTRKNKNNAAETLLYWNGYGGFHRDGSYTIRLKGRQVTPNPWINILSNAHFGMHISAEGAGFTWAGNSRDYQLTPWSNDSVCNRPGEALYIVDLVSKECFSPYSAVECNDDTLYEARFGLGYAAFTAQRGSLSLKLAHSIDTEKPLRFSRLRLTNTGAETRILRLYNYAEWVLGSNRAKTAPFILPAYDKKRSALLLSNPYSQIKTESVSFIAADRAASSITADRAEFIGAAGTVRQPQAVREGKLLSDTAEAGRDICSAMSYDLTIPPGESREIVFYLGCGENLAAAQKLLDYAKTSLFSEREAAQKTLWNHFTGNLRVESPDESFNLLVNHWLPYQTYACRILARAGFYQASGAFGFRDQLQDCLALLWLKPQETRRYILAAAARQFKEGDVQHWWLPETGAGIRSLISDDSVWLAYATALYAEHTGDDGIFAEEIPFLEGEAVPEDRSESYFTPKISAETADLYQHCRLALNLAIKRRGKHRLPLILSGDWNDGLNHVGAQGKGESVWLGWFLGKTLQDFIPIAQRLGDKPQAEAWKTELETLKKALEKAGWDGSWYRRAYYDDGAPLGSAKNDECQIDIIAQSWSIIAGFAPHARQKQAFQNIMSKLYDKEAHILRLFWPPFAETQRDPGYIKSYPPGVRENGGQYTHGAIWSIFAAAKLGEAETAYKLFSEINPIHHGANPEIYRVEPYIAAADIYSVAPHRGQGGWTWYTGSAGWLYRAATEAILGLKKQGDRLFLTPSLPKSWKMVKLQWRFGKALYHITIKQGSKSESQAVKLTINGAAANPAEGIALTRSGRHEIVLEMETAAAGKMTAAAAKQEKAHTKPRRQTAGKTAETAQKTPSRR